MPPMDVGAGSRMVGVVTRVFDPVRGTADVPPLVPFANAPCPWGRDENAAGLRPLLRAVLGNGRDAATEAGTAELPRVLILGR